jgi:enediyne biosynthesis protein E4
MNRVLAGLLLLALAGRALAQDAGKDATGKDATGKDAVAQDALPKDKRTIDLPPATLKSWLTEQATQLGLGSAQPFRILVADVNGDGYPDLLFLTSTAGAQLYLNQQRAGAQSPTDRTFVDFTAESGITKPGPGTDPSRTERRSFSAALADVDNDGDLDLFVGVYYHRIEQFTDYGDRNEIYLNDGKGHFTLKEGNGLHEAGLLNVAGATFLDYDGDGKIDLYLGLWWKDYTKQVRDNDRLYRGNGDGTFTDATAAAKIDARKGPTYGVNVADFNNDGWPDIVSSNYCRDPSILWRNNGDGTFSDVGGETGFAKSPSLGVYQNFCSWAAMPADYDNDGDIDFLYTIVHGYEGSGQYRSCPVVNRGAAGNFGFDWRIDLINRKDPKPDHHGDHYSAWIDLDNDGLTDLALSESGYSPGDRLYVFRQNADHTFEEITADLGLMGPDGVGLIYPHPVVRVDYDLDGDDDFLVGLTDTTPPHLAAFRNDVGTKNNWIAVSLAPTAGSGVNRAAIGARVVVTSGDLTLTRELYAGEGNVAGQQPLRLTFGLGQRTKVDSIKVVWPNKQRSVTTTVPTGIGKLVTIPYPPPPPPDAGPDAPADVGTNPANGGGGCGCGIAARPAQPLGALALLLLALATRAGRRRG